MKTCLNAATLLVLSLVLTAITAAQQFIDAPQYSTNSETLVVVNGDFNQDGNPDLAVGSNNAPLLILLGRGNGTFQRGESLGIETTYTQAIILGDWNGDGILDLAVAAYSNGNAVRVYLGVGNGSFTAGAVYPTSQTLVNIVSGDFNGDGVPDLVTSSYDYASSTVCVGVLLGSGDGTFAATGTSQVPGYYSNGLAVGDLNRDGRLDVVDAVASAPSGDNEIEVYLGNGDGSLQAPVSYSTPMEGNAVTLADLNGDGILDLATVWYDLAVLFGKGDGTFAPAQTYIELPGADGIAVADMNGDGSPDLIELHADYSRPGPDAVAVWGNKGDGTFSKPVLYATGYAPLALTVGDLNRDGRPDVVTANYYGKSLSILLSGGGGTLIGQRDYPVYHYGGGSVGPVALGYINADKNLDAVVVDTLGWRVFVLPGNPDGSFQAGQSYWTGDRGAAVALGDVNGDGATDIVTGNCFRTISVLLGDGKGRFKPHVEYTTDTEPHSVVLADVNNDGALDVLTGDFQGKSVSTLLNDGTGVFLPYIETHITDRVLSLAVGDLNKDGFIDFATANKPNGGISSFSIALGNGDGTFTVTQKTDTVSVLSVAIADVNKDGNLDVVVFGDGQIAFYPGNGDGTLGQRRSTATDLSTAGVLGDFNGDGRLDAASAGELLLGNGDGTFRSAQTYSTEAAGIASGDVNHDGALDLITSGGCCVGVLLNTGKQ